MTVGKATKLKPRHHLVLEYIARQGGRVTAMQFNDVLAGEPKAIRSMFARGLVAGDQIPARWVSLTEAGRAILAPGEEPKR